LTLLDHSVFEARVLLAAYGERLADAVNARMPDEELRSIVTRIASLGAIVARDSDVLTDDPQRYTVHPKSLGQELLAEIEDFLVETGMAPSKFGLGAASDSHLVHRLRRGLSVTLRTADKVRQYMRVMRPLSGERQFYRLHN